MDQGPYQGVWSVGFRSSADWNSLFDRFDGFLSRTAPDLVVLVEADTETIEERLHSREDGDTRFSPDTPEFDRGVDGYDSLKRLIHSIDSHESIVVENETYADLDRGVDRVVAAVESLHD
ncbi:Thymidylate kinase [Natranaeroarchaeum sulfidigenes]|uniref:Thymidylate kinase n=1 Tax=Natranaeroarchaeum sulfidigenes TaxID=2784880 RepID=A0A897MRW8_9EURY|nr:Thymidylate kinase [Natranaeroarchaeum sulfidigenes]